MYLKSLELHNFRSFEDIKIDFNENLTVIIGANGSGKSTIMEGIAIALSSMFVKVDGLCLHKTYICNFVGAVHKNLAHAAFTYIKISPI